LPPPFDDGTEPVARQRLFKAAKKAIDGLSTAGSSLVRASFQPRGPVDYPSTLALTGELLIGQQLDINQIAAA
jgi:hypothetical protein